MLELPPIFFGATSLGNLFRAISEQEKAAIIDACLQAPYQPIVIDSAGKYGAGLSLEVIGRCLAARSVPAQRVIISNKLGWRRIPLTTAEPTFEPGAWFDIHHDAVQDISYEGILRCWEEGNQLLGDYSADFVSVHDPDEYLAAATGPEDRARRMQDILDAYRALTELKQQGRATAIGVGSKDWRVIRELCEHCDFDWVMFANSFTIMEHPPELIEFMQQLAGDSVAIVNSALFHGGFLLGGEFYNYRPIDHPQNDTSELLWWRRKFQTVCEDHGQRPFDVGVAFGRSHPAVSSIALSTSHAERVATHLDVLDVDIPDTFWQQLKSSGLIAADYPYVG